MRLKVNPLGSDFWAFWVVGMGIKERLRVSANSAPLWLIYS